MALVTRRGGGYRFTPATGASGTGKRGEVPLTADAAWLLTPDSVLGWEGGTARLLRLGPAGPDLAVRLVQPPLVVSATGGAANPAALILIPAGHPVGTASSTVSTPGDRVLRLDRDLTQMLQLPSGAATALTADASGAFAVAWVGPGSPPTARLALFDGSGAQRWQAALPGPSQRLTLLTDGTVVAAVGRDVLALRHGQIAWRRALPAPPLGLAPGRGGGVLTALPNRLLCLKADGATDWELTPYGRVQALRVSPEGSKAVLIETEGVELIQITDTPGGIAPDPS